MAKPPSKSPGSRVSNIMGLLRGNFDFKKTVEAPVSTVAYGKAELVSAEMRTKILQGAFRSIPQTDNSKVTPSSVLGIVQASFNRVGSDRAENRKILQLLPEVNKAARLIVASIFSPNDLSRQNIQVVFDSPHLDQEINERLNIMATDYFENNLQLKRHAPSWVFQAGYETGSAIFAIVPLASFAKIHDESYVGTESFVKKVVEPTCEITLFGFGDGPRQQATRGRFDQEIKALETLSHQIVPLELSKVIEVRPTKTDESSPSIKLLIDRMIGTEALSLTDNPSILQLKTESDKKSTKRRQDILNSTFRKRPMEEGIVTVSARRDLVNKERAQLGRPILQRLPPEAVTVIHTPGDPNDHQGYLVLLDHTGNPIDVIAEQSAMNPNDHNYSQSQSTLFNQVYSAYGYSNQRSLANTEVMGRIYNQIVSEHIRTRLDKAGFNNAAIEVSDSVMRCMFTRFLQEKKTRVLFLPKDLVTYMTFEKDQNGYGVSRLDRIKFNLGMKMAVQVSRVLASIKAAMDNRKIEIRFTDNMLENPETVFADVIREYVQKSTMSFSTDPNQIQNQIADKSLSINGLDIPGMEQFSISNEPASRGSASDFDPAIQEYIDKGILNGLGVPAAAMNSLNEDEYARSVTTTNLFFAMDISIDQDVVISDVSDLLQKYSRYSEEFQEEIYKIIPSLRGVDETSKKENDSSIESPKDAENKEPGITDIPLGLTLDTLLDSLRITLPHPNIAPNKAQFEALSSMVTSITETVAALFPDDLMGSDDKLAPALRMLRAKFTAMNIRSYLETSGMNSIDIPDTEFADELIGIGKLIEGLQNVSKLMEQKTKLLEVTEAEAPVEPDADYQ